MSTKTPGSRRSTARRRDRSTVAPWPAVALVAGAVVILGVWLLTSFGGDPEDPDAAVSEPEATVERLSHIHGLQIPAWGDGAVYVSTHQGAFRIREDEWSWVSDQPHDFMGFAAHPSDGDVLYSSGHPAPGSDLPNPIGFMVSTDGGSTWQPRSLQGEVDFHAMAVHPEDGDILYGYDGRRGLLRTTDAGRSWEAVAAPALEEAGLMGLAVGRGDGVIYAATETGLLHSSDAGGSWRVLVEDAATAVHVDTSEPTRLVAYVLADGQGLVLSEDGGESWEPLGLVLDEDAAGHVAIDPRDPETIWAASFGESLWRTTDAGQQWQQLVEDGTRTVR